ncbi:MAG TPA: TerB family tellurite resistance protein [Burkholderiaceae bacterium]|nr:TerB family tellurite resistance protein [Burkholderiaceae bacterium]
MRKLKAWITRTLSAAEADPAAREQARNLAMASLLVEVLRADYETSEAERRQVMESLRNMLGLGEDACAELLADAEQQVDRAHDLHQFTAEVNRALAPEEKLRLVEQMWLGRDAVGGAATVRRARSAAPVRRSRSEN